MNSEYNYEKSKKSTEFNQKDAFVEFRINQVLEKKNTLNPVRCAISICRAAPGINKVSEFYPEDILIKPVAHRFMDDTAL